MSGDCILCEHAVIHPDLLEEGKIWCRAKQAPTKYTWKCNLFRERERKMTSRIEFERLESEDFTEKYREYQSIWECNKPPMSSNWDIYAILIWRAPPQLRKIVIERRGNSPWQRFIMWWLGYCIIGECTSVIAEKPEWLYDDIIFFLVHYYNYFGLPEMKWSER